MQYLLSCVFGGLLWKIYSGCKRSTKQEAAIFVLEKRQLDKFSKPERETILDTLRRGIAQLTKIRHPRILTVQHPLEESRESLAFATEPVFASLANILGQTVNMPQPANMSGYKLYDIEIKYGLLQIGEGLLFLHNDVKLLHRNIAPENVIINKYGAWKLFGFDFCVHNSSAHNESVSYPFQIGIMSMPTLVQPNFDFSAPECILDQEHGTSADIFSLGMLIYALHSPAGEVLFPARDVQETKKRAQQLSMPQLSQRLRCLPEALREHFADMLSVNATRRPTAQRFVKVIKTIPFICIFM